MMTGKSCSLIVVILLMMIQSSLSMTKCKKHELETLLKFKHSFSQDPQRVLSSWIGDDCCQWHGVSCDNITSNVIKLTLTNSLAYSDYPTTLVSSELSSALLDLKFLTHLDVSGNNFTGSHIPKFIGSMTHLRYLTLSYSGFSGPIPPQLGNLTNLIRLELGDFGEHMIYTEERLDWVSGLTKLQFLDMSGTNMSQTYDTLQVLFRLPSLLQLFLYDCLLDKTHLSKLLISNTSTLQDLDLSHNKFEGPFPSFLKNMPFLQLLSLSKNSFSGGFPIWLGNLRCLEYLDLAKNNFTGLIQDIFGQLTELEYLDISSNSIHGTVSHIGDFTKLTDLNMNNNNIKLNFGTNWRPPFQLQHFGAKACGINATFPQWLRNQTHITSLDLSYTGIVGELPQWLWNFTNLNALVLAGNKLTGTLPRNFNGRNLEWLDLQNNMLSGTIPYWLKHMKTIYLLSLSRNMLSGRIFEGENASSLLSGSKSLQLLDLSDNMLSGEMQFTGEYLHASLVVLRLGRNYFSGLISPKLCDLTYLAVLDLAQNSFTGHIPGCLGSLRFEAGIFGFGKSITEFQEVIKGTIEDIVGGRPIAHSMIDLSCNRLVGTIPEELTKITNLNQINLSNNHLTGGIPDDIGNLQLLESLDLSNNTLFGTIPQSLSAVPWLSVLNLSNNNLDGEIPTGSQLQTLVNPSSYVGNPGLCGFPLPNKCSNPKLPLSPTDDDGSAEKDDGGKDKLDQLWLYLAVMSGVATGFWGVVLTLIFKKSWRHAYFRFVEKVADKIYVPFKVRMNRFKRASLEREF
ncbi:uncharacterized protein LOC141618075 [Silene latifolia]|uniref:uncharacterized protein LOC141618075 n=1 Tax=Silene latifolia TaxID=37657 RepID=UPI003D788356